MGGLRTITTSPILIIRDGLAVTSGSLPLILRLTRPFLQLSVATVLVLNTRMAQSHLSILTSVFMTELY